MPWLPGFSGIRSRDQVAFGRLVNTSTPNTSTTSFPSFLDSSEMSSVLGGRPMDTTTSTRRLNASESSFTRRSSRRRRSGRKKGSIWDTPASKEQKGSKWATAATAFGSAGGTALVGGGGTALARGMKNNSFNFSVFGPKNNGAIINNNKEIDPIPSWKHHQLGLANWREGVKSLAPSAPTAAVTAAPVALEGGKEVVKALRPNSASRPLPPTPATETREMEVQTDNDGVYPTIGAQEDLPGTKYTSRPVRPDGQAEDVYAVPADQICHNGAFHSPRVNNSESSGGQPNGQHGNRTSAEGGLNPPQLYGIHPAGRTPKVKPTKINMERQKK